MSPPVQVALQAVAVLLGCGGCLLWGVRRGRAAGVQAALDELYPILRVESESRKTAEKALAAAKASLATVDRWLQAKTERFQAGFRSGCISGQWDERARVLTLLDTFLLECPGRGHRRAALEEVRGLVDVSQQATSGAQEPAEVTRA